MVDLLKICDDYGIKVLSASNCGWEENIKQSGGGCALMNKGQPYIIYDDTATPTEKRYTVAHELAHILLGHYRPECTVTHEDKEQEARIFGTMLVALEIADKNQTVKSA